MQLLTQAFFNGPRNQSQPVIDICSMNKPRYPNKSAAGPSAPDGTSPAGKNTQTGTPYAQRIRQGCNIKEGKPMVESVPVLIVDENQAMLAMLQRFLLRQGLGVHTTTRVAEAKTLIAQHMFQLVLTDLFWPSDKGLCLVRHVHRMVPQTRLIVMSAFPEHETRQHAVAAGADVCLDKPFRLRQLWEVIQNVLGTCCGDMES
jgi:CheY-like chemotaxis protein